MKQKSTEDCPQSITENERETQEYRRHRQDHLRDEFSKCELFTDMSTKGGGVVFVCTCISLVCVCVCLVLCVCAFVWVLVMCVCVRQEKRGEGRKGGG